MTPQHRRRERREGQFVVVCDEWERFRGVCVHKSGANGACKGPRKAQ